MVVAWIVVVSRLLVMMCHTLAKLLSDGCGETRVTP